jgi:hypothetical protein
MRAQEKKIPWDSLSGILLDLDQACINFDHQKVRDILLKTVDEYCPQCDIVDPLWLKVEQKIRKESRKSTAKLELMKG